ncbi:hypothetical protein [Porphyromonas sp. oral taxon 275]|uniref:hypothetical protein n=1 Tax=Porphyromonas sp. oral taxon 275 TaxID=712435 RepID=UPI001BAB96CA|nr:hypothetical protein [Porphyromonas sp. oral taxon 275]QUB43837.1 hypothetical protein J4862_04270 [Porphyromonas sp. oral taxon 275]
MKIDQMTPQDWSSLAEKAHRNAVANGFYAQTPSDEHLRMLAICELAEAIEADRKGRRAVADEWIDNCSDNLAFHAGFNHHIKDTVEDELADFIIRCLEYVGWRIEKKEWSTKFDVPFELYQKDVWDTKDKLTNMAYLATDCMFAYVPDAMECVLSYCQFAGIDIMRYVDIKMRYSKILLLWRRKKH